LSWGAIPPGAATAVTTANSVANTVEFASESKVGLGVKKKVAMAFIYGKEDKASQLEARKWLTSFGIPASKTEEPEIVKYMVEVPGAEKLSGIKLLDVLEKSKDKDEKVSYVENKIIDFFKTIKTKSINGNNWKERRVDNLGFAPVPLHEFGLKSP
jgi:hypothetical protein